MASRSPAISEKAECVLAELEKILAGRRAVICVQIDDQVPLAGFKQD